jgi:hypothetical protein
MAREGSVMGPGAVRDKSRLHDVHSDKPFVASGSAAQRSALFLPEGFCSRDVKARRSYVQAQAFRSLAELQEEQAVNFPDEHHIPAAKLVQHALQLGPIPAPS